MEMVTKWWTNIYPSGCGVFVLAKKVAGLRGQLRHWAKFSFISIKLKKLALLQEIEVLDIAKETRRLSAVESRQELILIERLEETRKQEEIY